MLRKFTLDEICRQVLLPVDIPVAGGCTCTGLYAHIGGEILLIALVPGWNRSFSGKMSSASFLRVLYLFTFLVCAIGAWY